jgi:hypothetical protein
MQRIKEVLGKNDNRRQKLTQRDNPMIFLVFLFHNNNTGEGLLSTHLVESWV